MSASLRVPDGPAAEATAIQRRVAELQQLASFARPAAPGRRRRLPSVDTVFDLNEQQQAEEDPGRARETPGDSSSILST
jgi:hypothetical protein